MLPLIGIMPLYDDEKDSYWMLPGYMKMIEESGGVPVMLPLTPDRDILLRVSRLCGGFILTGGHDVSPELYGAVPSEQCGVVCEERDAAETFILNYADKKDIPVLGICRGIQFINVHYGGTLYQDLPTEYNGAIDHHMTPPYDRPAHKVRICPDTILSEILQTDEIGVNSYHHQAIRKLAPPLDVMAVSEDGLTEAVSLRGKRFIVGVQWHPEFSYRTDGNSVKIVRAFVRAADGRSHAD